MAIITAPPKENTFYTSSLSNARYLREEHFLITYDYGYLGILIAFVDRGTAGGYKK